MNEMNVSTCFEEFSAVERTRWWVETGVNEVGGNEQARKLFLRGRYVALFKSIPSFVSFTGSLFKLLCNAVSRISADGTAELS
jgi:hypothetical protein